MLSISGLSFTKDAFWHGWQYTNRAVGQLSMMSPQVRHRKSTHPSRTRPVHATLFAEP
jgi:hypothetical protein